MPLRKLALSLRIFPICTWTVLEYETDACMHAHIHIYIYMRAHAHIHAHTHTHIHIHTHTYIYIHTYIATRPFRLGGHKQAKVEKPIDEAAYFGKVRAPSVPASCVHAANKMLYVDMYVRYVPTRVCGT